MATSKNAKIEFEAGQAMVNFVAMTDSGDHRTFTVTDKVWSGESGKEPDIRPNGITTGNNLLSANATNNVVNVAGFTANSEGTEHTVAATTATITRPDATHLLLTFAAAGYTAAVAGDIGKTVVGGTTTDSGTLVAYNNVTRQWVIDQVDSGDIFDDDDEAITITTGTGAGSLEGVGVVASYIINSVTMTDAGAIAVVQGTQGIAFSETRAAIGGPPEIPADSVEIGQVRVTATADAAILESEIFQAAGTHTERFDSPTWQSPVNTIGLGLNAATVAEKHAHVKFDAVIPAIHTGAALKKVYIKYYTPTYSEVQRAVDFKPVGNTHSARSTPVYGNKTIGSLSSSIGQGGFKAYTSDNITDALLDREDKVTTIRHYADRNKTAYTLTQGTIGLKPTNPVEDQNYVDATITAEIKTARFAS